MPMQRSLRSVLLIGACSAAVLVLAAACATIVRGTSQDISINSTPSSARVMVNGADMGATPTRITLKRDKTYQVIFQKEGFEDVTLNIDRAFQFTPAVIGNLFSWGIIGLVVDVANGSAYELEPEQLDATLTARGI